MIDLSEDVQRHSLRSGTRPPEVFGTELTRSEEDPAAPGNAQGLRNLIPTGLTGRLIRRYSTGDVRKEGEA